MKINAIVHKAEEGGFWAEVPSIPGCATQGETMEELRANLREAIEGCLSIPIDTPSVYADDEVIELAL
jgi:predicted RNase H-like HicB family nuclease